MKKFDYAMSAPFMSYLPTNSMLEENPNHPLYKQYSRLFELAHEYSDKTFQILKPKYSFLINAYNEPGRLGFIKNFGFGFDNLYIDSGGLQMANSGIPIDAAARQGIYEVQSHGDVAFCFDQIPLWIDPSFNISAENRRSSIIEKVFVTSDQEKSGRDTGRNVNEQINFFKDKDSGARVLLIIQGNNIQDMQDFFNYAVDEISIENQAYMLGVAPADTCMGNDTLESCDMLGAWRKIYEDGAPDWFYNQLHFLGIGGFERFYPIVNCMKTGFIPDKINVTADSSKHSMGYSIGRYYGRFGESPKYGQRPNPGLKKIFNKVWTHFSEVIEPYYKTEDEYYNWFSERIKSFDLQRGSMYDDETNRFSRFNVFIHNLSSVVDMFEGFDLIFQGKFKHKNKMLSMLNHVTDYQSYMEWRRMAKPYIPSKRIKRNDIKKQPFATLEDFF